MILRNFQKLVIENKLNINFFQQNYRGLRKLTKYSQPNFDYQKNESKEPRLHPQSPTFQHQSSSKNYDDDQLELRNTVFSQKSVKNRFLIKTRDTSTSEKTTALKTFKKPTTTVPEESYEDVNSTKLIIPSAQLLPGVEPTSIPTFNIAAYLKTSPTLQELLKLGVDFSKIEKRKGLGQFILKLNFDEHVKPHLFFLKDIGVPSDQFGEIITKNPLLFKVDLNDLQTRINYLQLKKFSAEQIQRICTKNPFWLMFSTTRIDKRLGYFQINFKLNGNDVRFLATKQPKLITYKMENIRDNTFCIKEEMGFNGDELKVLLLSKPRLWMIAHNHLIERFDFVHNEMKISHDEILKFPEILISREFRIRQRHEYLKLLGRAVYDCTKDLYISLNELVAGTDQEFVVNVAKTDMISYDKFLRTL